MSFSQEIFLLGEVTSAGGDSPLNSSSFEFTFANLRAVMSLLFPLKDLFEPQTALLRYVLEQPYSKDMVCNMLGLNKQVLYYAGGRTSVDLMCTVLFSLL